MKYRILPPEGMIEARAAMPPSKSIINRLLIINALTPGHPDTPGIDTCDDTRVLAEALRQGGGKVDVGACGTAMRFLTAYYAATEGAEVTLDGSERMRQRPIGTLVEALRSLGADIEYAGEEGFPPLRIHGHRLEGGTYEIDAQVSSQFVSALLMTAPSMTRGLRLAFVGDPVSLPYIKMTMGLMERHGIECDMDHDGVTVAPGSYRAIAHEVVEGDWSAAAFWYEIAAISAGFVTLDGLERHSLQGDSHVASLFEEIGVSTEWDGEEGGIDLAASPDQAPRLVMDLGSWPDLVPSIVVSAAMLGIPFRIAGLASLRIKECDRCEALVTELGRLGIKVTLENNTLSWELQRFPIAELPCFSTHGDHRMAMALAPVSIFVPGIVIDDIEVVEKSYPQFWEHLRQAGFTLLDGDAPLPDPIDDDGDGDDAVNPIGPTTDSIGL